MTSGISKRIAWIMGTIIPGYILLVFACRAYTKNNDSDLSPFLLISWAVLLCTAFFRLLYSEKSPVWNGIIAFLFWMPLAGWYWLQPSEEAILTRNIYTAIIEVFKIALAHGAIQFLGRVLINIQGDRANKPVSPQNK